MTDYLGRLAARSLGVARSVEPRLAGPYEGWKVGEEVEIDEREETWTPPPAGRAASPAASPTPAPLSSRAEARPEATTGREEQLARPAPEAPPAVRADGGSELVELAAPRAAPEDPGRAARAVEGLPEIVGVAVRPAAPPVIRPAVSGPVERHRGASPLARPDARSAHDPPAVRVTIGRIDVRAVTKAPRPPAAKRAAAQPTLSLDEYLRRRSGGRA